MLTKEKKVMGKTGDSKVSKGGYGKINRKEEDELVLLYQETRDERIIEKLFKQRQETFRNLAYQNGTFIEDLESEARLVFVKAVNGYGRSKGRVKSFNTYYFTSFKNHLKNLNKSKNRKKRTTHDDCNPEEYFIRLDDEVDNTSSDNLTNTFHDVICDDGKSVSRDAAMNIMIEDLEEKSWIMADVLRELVCSRVNMNRRAVYEKSFNISLNNNPDPIKNIEIDTGIPKRCFRVVSHSVSSNIFHYKISISRKTIIEEMKGHFGEWVK